MELRYSLPPAKATASQVSVPLTVRVSASGKRGSKLYLSRVTGSLTAIDTSGWAVSLDETLQDAANISPGYIISPPATYTQVFLLPPTAADVRTLAVDLRFETLLLQPKSNPRDFSKLTLNDRLTIGRT